MLKPPMYLLDQAQVWEDLAHQIEERSRLRLLLRFDGSILFGLSCRRVKCGLDRCAQLHRGRSICLTIIIGGGGVVVVLIRDPWAILQAAKRNKELYFLNFTRLSLSSKLSPALLHRIDCGISRAVIENRGGHRFGVTPFRVRESRQD